MTQQFHSALYPRKMLAYVSRKYFQKYAKGIIHKSKKLEIT